MFWLKSLHVILCELVVSVFPGLWRIATKFYRSICNMLKYKKWYVHRTACNTNWCWIIFDSFEIIGNIFFQSTISTVTKSLPPHQFDATQNRFIFISFSIFFRSVVCELFLGLLSHAQFHMLQMHFNHWMRSIEELNKKKNRINFIFDCNRLWKCIPFGTFHSFYHIHHYNAPLHSP